MALDAAVPVSTGAGRRSLSVYVTIFAVLLAAPGAATLLRHRPGSGLGGVESEARIARATISTWMEGSFQADFEQWVDQNNVMRRVLVKTANQINFSLFSEIMFKKSSQLILGKERTLYQSSYIDSYNGVDLLPDEHLDAFARDLRHVQDRLSARGVAFLFFLTPSKASVEPQDIPDSLLRPGAGVRTNYQRLLPFLDRHGVQHLDAHAAVVALKSATGYPAFPKGGAHWNYYTSLRITQELVSRMEALSGKRMAHLSIKGLRWDLHPYGTDGDLITLVNVWRPSPFYSRNPLPEVQAEAAPDVFRPNVLTVGGSFMEVPNYWLWTHGVVADASEFLSYYRKPIRDLEQEVFRRNVVILETNETMISRRGFGFLETLLAP